MTSIAGIPMPFVSPALLAIVALHVAVGLVAVITGLLAMLSRKGPGRHSVFGTVYFWCLATVFGSAAALAGVRWAEDYHLFILGALAFGAVWLGRAAIRHGQPRLHLMSMAASYILLLTAFYVDNGPNLPFWRLLPPIAFWLLPGAIGIPGIAYVLHHHPLTRRTSA
jgi:uncharacterized membrane protein